MAEKYFTTSTEDEFKEAHTGSRGISHPEFYESIKNAVANMKKGEALKIASSPYDTENWQNTVKKNLSNVLGENYAVNSRGGSVWVRMAQKSKE